MNKYQEALNNLVKVSCKSGKYCKECEMNKVCNCEAKSYIDTLQELVGNPPLKFDELEEGMWVWDNLWYEKNYVLIKRIFYEGANRCVAMLQDEEGMARLFEENRFYRREVMED